MNLTTEEVVAQLSERGTYEWQAAVLRAEIVRLRRALRAATKPEGPEGANE